MGRYLLQRSLLALITLIAVTLVVFAMMRASGDPATLLLPPEAGPEDVRRLRTELGLDRPWYAQFGRFLLKAGQGDFERSFTYRTNAMNVAMQHYPATIKLAVTAFAAAAVVGIPLGVLSATRSGSLGDRLIVVVAVAGQALPTFWVGMMMILIFAVTLQWLPVSGSSRPFSLVLPAATLTLGQLALVCRVVRSEMLEVLGLDYIRTARAKGLAEWKVTFKHALRNASLSIVTVLGLQLGSLVSGAVVTETVFAWPGLGRLIVNSVFLRDYPLVLACVFLVASLVVIVNLVVDLGYAMLDPRIRYD